MLVCEEVSIFHGLAILRGRYMVKTGHIPAQDGADGGAEDDRRGGNLQARRDLGEDGRKRGRLVAGQGPEYLGDRMVSFVQP